MNRRKFFGVLAAGLATPKNALKKLATAPVEPVCADAQIQYWTYCVNTAVFNAQNFHGHWQFITVEPIEHWGNTEQPVLNVWQ